MNNNDKEEEKKFKASINDFLANNGVKRQEDPYYDEFKLYKLICRRGGYQVHAI